MEQNGSAPVLVELLPLERHSHHLSEGDPSSRVAEVICSSAASIPSHAARNWVLHVRPGTVCELLHSVRYTALGCGLLADQEEVKTSQAFPAPMKWRFLHLYKWTCLMLCRSYFTAQALSYKAGIQCTSTSAILIMYNRLYCTQQPLYTSNVNFFKKFSELHITCDN